MLINIIKSENCIGYISIAGYFTLYNFKTGDDIRNDHNYYKTAEEALKAVGYYDVLESFKQAIETLINYWNQDRSSIPTINIF